MSSAVAQDGFNNDPDNRTVFSVLGIRDSGSVLGVILGANTTMVTSNSSQGEGGVMLISKVAIHLQIFRVSYAIHFVLLIVLVF